MVDGSINEEGSKEQEKRERQEEKITCLKTLKEEIEKVKIAWGIHKKR